MKKVPRILGLIIASVVAGIFLAFSIGGIFENNETPLTFEDIGITALAILTTISAIFAWFKVKVGAWMMLVSGLLFAIFALLTAGGNRIIAMVPAGGALLSSLLLLWGVQLERKG
ncbi:MAG: hypothetical protein H0S79_25980 [Anaerolineaceae bacterium]|nr:hypothetical protein [Anaerolineaceae bacterium]